ncbi:MAG: vitamin K epoxide reductase family protein [Segetibacter sp.]
MLTGVVVTSLLLWYEIDKTNPLLQKVCTGISKGNCNAILTGKQSKLLSWLSWSEIGFFYFTGGLLVLLFAGSDVTNTISLLGWLNILALPYTVFSVYYQWRVAKQWCVLCLAVQALLVLGGINVIANNYLTSFSTLPISFLIKNIHLYLLPVLSWYVVKPYILHLQEAKNTKREYLRIKFNTEIFSTLLKKQKHISISTEGLGINLGNPNATNTLIKVCNPY